MEEVDRTLQATFSGIFGAAQSCEIPGQFPESREKTATIARYTSKKGV
jgi:hypothetical protein